MEQLEGKLTSMKTLSSRSKVILFSAMLILVVLVGIVDYATGSELAFSIFYLFPVGITAWYVGLKSGVFMSVASAFTWYVADTLARSEPYSNPFIPSWNTVVRVMTFLIVTVLLNLLRETLQRESIIARIDPLTEAANTRAFYEEAEKHIALIKRYQRPFSVLYLDVDNFKQLNDTHGHSAGDSALRILASTLKQNLRTGDTIARFGGDEFAVLLAEADASAAELISARIQSTIRHNLPFTCSMGVLTCSSPPGTVDDIVEKVDNLMYEAKRGGKDTKMSSTFTGT
jgi:diguanylate cyclase (GGDEF)-like protein